MKFLVFVFFAVLALIAFRPEHSRVADWFEDVGREISRYSIELKKVGEELPGNSLRRQSEAEERRQSGDSFFDSLLKSANWEKREPKSVAKNNTSEPLDHISASDKEELDDLFEDL